MFVTTAEEKIDVADDLVARKIERGIETSSIPIRHRHFVLLKIISAAPCNFDRGLSSAGRLVRGDLTLAMSEESHERSDSSSGPN